MARVNVMLPDDLLGQIDHVAEQEGVNRSKLLRLAVMAYFDQREDYQEREKRRTEIRHAMEIQDALRREIEPWDPLKALRAERQEV
ncbi:MAG: CopG family ribbon-helix-helix protein [Candidatus Latescibacterota bacterium]